MLRNLSQNNKLLMSMIFVWALSIGLWYNQRQLYLDELGATASQIGKVLALESILGAMVQIPAGIVADRIGPRKVILFSLQLGIAGILLMVLAHSWQAAAVSLVLQRSSAAANPAMVTFVLLNASDQNPAGNANKTLTTVFGAWPAAQIVSPALGGFIAQATTIRSSMGIAGGGLLVSLLIILLTKSVKADRGPDEAASTSLLKNRSFLLLAGFFTLATVVQFVGYVLAPNFLQEVRGFSLATIGTLFSIFSTGALMFNFITGRIQTERSFVLLLFAPGLALLGLWRTDSIVTTGAAFFLLGGISTMWAVMNAGIARVVRQENQGQAFGILGALIFVSTAAASWSAGTLYDATPTHDLPIIAGIVGITLVLAMWFVVRMAVAPSVRKRSSIPEKAYNEITT